MEQKHKQRIATQFPGEMRYKTTHVLDIPDEYQFMDPDLIEEIQSSVDSVLDARLGTSES